jgi:GTP pyrophosphokinase
MNDSTECADSLHDLLEIVRPRCNDKELALIRRAYEVAEAAHIDQRRSSGEAYITHPLAVACILTQIKLDSTSIAAALLHDVAEDTPVTLDEIRAQFGNEIGDLVDAVTKLSQRESVKDFSPRVETATNGGANLSETFAYRTDREAESLRKMLLGLVKDIRVVLIKLADRLHNMRTLSALKPEKQKKIARETLDIYAPLANRLGIWEWKQELEDLGLRFAEPEQYQQLSERVEAAAAERERHVRQSIDMLRDALSEIGITNVHITGRAKQIYSILKKMRRKNAAFESINDAQALRVIIEDKGYSAGAVRVADDDDTAGETDLGEESDNPRRDRKLAERAKLMADPFVQMCYQTLGVAHSLWTPIPGEFDDYIAVPKDNHYQSLHTAVIDDKGKTLEVQIRTRSMHNAAEFGVAAHWLYKNDAKLDAGYQKQIELLREAIKSIGNDSEDANEFVDAVQSDHFKENVFAFTPKGKVIELPKGATIIDFAYRIHSDIGDRVRGGKVNGEIKPLIYKIQNGDQVEVLTRKDAQPSRNWLDDSYTATANARGKIRSFFRKQAREHNVQGGRDMIEDAIRRSGVSGWMKIDDVYRLFKIEKGKEEEFLEKVGFGNVSSMAIDNRIMEEDRRREKEKQERSFGIDGIVNLFRSRAPQAKEPENGRGQFVVSGVHGLQVQLAQCCKPVPGDPVVGYITRGQGIKVHHTSCKNIVNAEQERLIEVDYVGSSQEAFLVEFLVTAAERVGLLGELATALGEQKINISDVRIGKRNVKHGEVDVWIKAEVTSIKEVALAMNRLKTVKNVFDVERVNNDGRRGNGR